MITSLAGSLKSAVIPMLKPTVLYAEKHSNAILMRSLSLSVIDIKMIPTPITTRDRDITAKALRTEMSDISLR
jgi:hypothetical protein